MSHTIQVIKKSEWPTLKRNTLITIGLHKTKIGKLLIGSINGHLTWLSFWDAAPSEDAYKKLLNKRFPGIKIKYDESETEAFARATETLILTPESNTEIPLLFIASDLQAAVWQALLKIPAATTATYTEIAERVERPLAVRAVGTTIGQNPISIVVPCHRVLPRSGGIGSYAWGSHHKSMLLNTESAVN